MCSIRNFPHPNCAFYILIMKSIDSKLGYCFKSFNDLADELNIKRDTAMKIVSNLVNLHLVRKQRKMRYDNRKVYADNSYSLKVIKLIKKRNKPGLHSGLISFKNILKHTDNPTITELNSLRNYNNAIGSICQVGQGDYSVIFLKTGVAPKFKVYTIPSYTTFRKTEYLLYTNMILLY